MAIPPNHRRDLEQLLCQRHCIDAAQRTLLCKRQDKAHIFLVVAQDLKVPLAL